MIIKQDLDIMVFILRWFDDGWGIGNLKLRCKNHDSHNGKFEHSKISTCWDIVFNQVFFFKVK